AEMLASPVANTRMPHASDLPTLEPVAAGPAETGPFILSVTGANTGPLPRAQPVNQTAQVIASSRGFNMDTPPSRRTRDVVAFISSSRDADHQRSRAPRDSSLALWPLVSHCLPPPRRL